MCEIEKEGPGMMKSKSGVLSGQKISFCIDLICKKHIGSQITDRINIMF